MSSVFQTKQSRPDLFWVEPVTQLNSCRNHVGHIPSQLQVWQQLSPLMLPAHRLPPQQQPHSPVSSLWMIFSPSLCSLCGESMEPVLLNILTHTRPGRRDNNRRERQPLLSLDWKLNTQVTWGQTSCRQTFRAVSMRDPSCVSLSSTNIYLWRDD